MAYKAAHKKVEHRQTGRSAFSERRAGPSRVGLAERPSAVLPPRTTARGRRRLGLTGRLVIAVGVFVVLVGVAAIVLLLTAKPSVSVAAGTNSLFTVRSSGLGSSLGDVTVTSDGKPVSVTAGGDGYVPASQLGQGKTVTVTATVHSSGALSWLVGSSATKTETFTTPTAKPITTMAVSSTPGEIQVPFDHQVSVVHYKVGNGASKTVTLSSPSKVANLEVPDGLAGTLTVSASPWTWERTAKESTKLTWFAPKGSAPVAIVSPSPNSQTAGPLTPITISLDKPVSQVLGSNKPTLSPAVPGTWSEPTSTSLVFTPTSFGYGPGAEVTVSFPNAVNAVGMREATTTASSSAAKTFSFSTQAGSLTRMDQMLADLHYLPLDFTPSAAKPTTTEAEVAAIDQPVAGNFSWRWSNTPSALRAFWSPGQDTEMLKGALGAFLSTQPGFDGYSYTSETVYELATPQVWQELIQADLANKTDPYPYTYAYVTKSLPQHISLWQNGKTVLSAAANTGIRQDPTVDGTFPVYLRQTVGIMAGTNPDGSKYHDIVHWISYFNGSDAVHAFPRATYGSPQSLGCVELPAATGERAYHDMAIGDLVTVTG